MKATELRTLLANVLADRNVHFGDNTGSFGDNNYKINYQIKNTTLLEYERTFIIDFDIWCKDEVEVDELADTIESLFNYKTYDSATFYLENRYNADEKEVYRRTLTYEVRTFNEN